MIRIELIANHSVEENVLEEFQHAGVGKFYTKYSGVFGVGAQGPRMGDAIWPEENFTMVIWCEEEEAQGIRRAIRRVKEQFPSEGIKLFSMGDTTAAVPVKPEPETVPVTPAVPESVPEVHIGLVGDNI